MVGKKYEQEGIIKHGAKLINAVSNSTVPAITIMTGASYGAGNYAMSGRAYAPRFLFTWPNHRIAVMGGKQLAGVLDIIQREAAAKRGETVDEQKLGFMKAMIEKQIDKSRTRTSPPPGCGTTASGRQPRRDRRPRHAHLPARWASRPSRSTPTPTPTRPTSSSPIRRSHRPAAGPRELPEHPVKIAPPRPPAPTRSTPATASCRRTPDFAEVCEAAGKLTFIGPRATRCG
jgi:hypothetical protein